MFTGLWGRLFDGPLQWDLFLAALVPTLLLALFAARLARRALQAAIAGLLQDTVDQASPAVRGPLRLVGFAVFLLVAGTLLFPAFELAGLQPRTGIDVSTLAAWALSAGLRVLLIVLLAYAVVRTAALLVSRFEHEVSRGTSLDALERAKRARTLGSVITKVVTTLVIGIALLMVLGQFNVNIAPVLTGAGIVGLAVGFGAQTLVRDVISGFFLILEDQVRVGDVAAINGTGGLVEAINLRTIVLRDLEGTVHVFPNGAIQTLANRTKEFSYYVIDLDISYREDPERVARIARETAQEMRDEAAFGPFILEPLDILGVDAFRDYSVVLKMRIKTVPLKQWEVGREFRKRLKRRFEQEQVEIPFPERVVTVREGRERERDDRNRAGGAAAAG